MYFMCSSKLQYKSARGFTLVELVIIIVIIGILAVTAAPRIFTVNQVQPSLIQSELTSALQTLQQQAMNDTVAGDECYGVAATGSDYLLTNCRSDNTSFALRDLTVTWSQNGSALTLPLYFNALGCLAECGVGDIEISLVGSSTSFICIRNQGYIEARSCS